MQREPMYRIPLGGLDPPDSRLRQQDLIKFAVARAEQADNASTSPKDAIQMLQLFVAALFRQVEERALYEDVHHFFSSVSGVVSYCALVQNWDAQQQPVVRTLIFPFLAAHFDGRNPVLWEVLKHLKVNGDALVKENALIVELICMVVKQERDTLFSHATAMADSDLFPPMLSGLLFKIASFDVECVKHLAHPMSLTLIMKALRKDPSGLDPDEYLQLVAVLVHVMPHAAIQKTLRLPDFMPDLLLVLSICLRLIASNLRDKPAQADDQFAKLLIDSDTRPTALESFVVLGRFSVLGINEAAEIARDRSISELSMASNYSQRESVEGYTMGSNAESLPHEAAPRPSMLHLRVACEATHTSVQAAPILDEGRRNHIASLVIQPCKNGISSIEYEVVTANGGRHRISLSSSGTHVGASRVVDMLENDYADSHATDDIGMNSISVVLDPDEIFHGLTVRRQGGVVRDLRLITSRRVTPWLLATHVGEMNVLDRQDFEIQQLDCSHFTPGFSASTLWPFVTTIHPVMGLVIGRETKATGRITDIGIITRSATHNEPRVDDAVGCNLRVSITLQLYWLLYTLFPSNTLRWLKTEAATDTDLGPIVSTLLSTVRVHPRLMASTESERAENSWEGWSAMQIVAMTRDLCRTPGSSLRQPNEHAALLPNTNEIVESGYVLDLGSMLRRSIVESNYSRKPSLPSASPRNSETNTGFGGPELRLHDRPRARSSAPALALNVSQALPQYRYDVGATTQLQLGELKHAAQLLRQDPTVWSALTSYLLQQQDRMRVVESAMQIEKLRCSQLQQQLVDLQQSNLLLAEDMEIRFFKKLTECKALYECKIKQLYDDHRLFAEESKADHQRWRRDLTMRMLKYDVVHRNLADENVRLRHEITELREALEATERRQHDQLASSYLAGATRESFMHQKAEADEAIVELEMARTKLAFAEETAMNLAKKEAAEQLALRDSLIQSLSTHLLMANNGGTHQLKGLDATNAKPLESGVVRMLLAELKKGSSQTAPEDHHGLPNLPGRRRSLSAEGADAVQAHYRTRSDSTSGHSVGAPNGRALIEALEKIRHLEFEAQQQSTLLDQAKNEVFEVQQVASAQIRAIKRKETSLLAVIATLERRIIELLRENALSASSQPAHTHTNHASASTEPRLSFRSSTVKTMSTGGSDSFDFDADPPPPALVAAVSASSEPTATRVHSRASARSPISSSDEDEPADRNPRQYSKYSISSAPDDSASRRRSPDRPKDQCRQS